MSYVFRLHETGNVQLKGWERTSRLAPVNIQTIKDTIQHGQTSKIGSSIPTPLARLYLFETAFQMVADEPYGDSMYHHLVSDCLDMFQFLYMKADDDDLTFKKWNVQRQIEGLKKSNFLEHQQLGNSLEMAFNSRKLSGTTEIYLIYYKEKLVGGTSPLTGLYTTPNWKRNVKSEGWHFPTNIEDVLFDETPYTIYNREDDFQIYMYKSIYAHNDQLGSVSPGFYNYFDNCRRNVQKVDKLCRANEISPSYSQGNLKADYEPITFKEKEEGNTETLYYGKCLMVKKKAGGIPSMIQEKSDFLMQPSTDHYMNKKDNDGNPIKNYPPLVLVNGNHKMNYIDNEWDPNFKVPDVPSIPLHKRKLPNNQYKYPYVTIGDFFEGTLIELPYNINQEKFYTGFNGNLKYLLPIKKEYFNFFTIEDLKRHLNITKKGTTFEVNLSIPLKGGRSLQFSKSYDTTSSTDVASALGGRNFLLGFFPFYKVIDKPELNRYNVLLASGSSDLKVNFFQFPNIVHNKKLPDVERVDRTQQTSIDLGSTYFSIKETSFDLIEVSFGPALNGLVLPEMEQIEVGKHNKEFTFAIDFGTSNTHVAYTTNDLDKKEESFDINVQDQQMVFLSQMNKEKKNLDQQVLDGLGTIAPALTMIEREYVPSFISDEVKTNFPIRTAICEDHSFRNEEPKLFGNINIGFALERYNSGGNYGYQTNIKWMLNNSGNDQRPKARIEIFFEELMWLIKNKVILNGGKISPAPRVITMVPISMRISSRDEFLILWQNAADRVFGSNVLKVPEAKLESVVPYYKVVKNKARNALNIDIGGGTTDIFFFYKENKKFYSTSFRFAGNDIWGEGVNNTGDKDNGFFLLLDKLYEEGEAKLTDNNLGTTYRYFKSAINLGSADICSFLFKYDAAFKFSDLIKKHKPLKTILFIHLSGIIYQISQIINAKGEKLPEVVSFTGKGSNYLKLLSVNYIQKITKRLFEIFSGQKARDSFKVFLADNPKRLTAEGAITELSASGKEKIEESNIENITFLGFSTPVEEKEQTQSSQEDSSTDEASFNPLQPIMIEQLPEYKEAIKKGWEEFLKKLELPEMKLLMNEFDVKLRYDGFKIIDFLKEYGPDSYRTVAYDFDVNYDEDELLNENPFFWFLKDSLYMLSKELYKKN